MDRSRSTTGIGREMGEDIAREFRNPQFRNIFMNIPGVSPQATILDLLNEAAVDLENGEPEYARHLVRRAVNVLDRTKGRGWYAKSDVQPIQAMILRYAKEKDFQKLIKNSKPKTGTSREIWTVPPTGPEKEG